ncbi:MAG: hypothetical protein LAP86_34365 [Acidobacteriia bacterium]|nr:hypothetical protein [Terriglobia bacterium]
MLLDFSAGLCNPIFQTEGFDAWLDKRRVGGGTTWSAQIEHEISAQQVTTVPPGLHGG